MKSKSRRQGSQTTRAALKRRHLMALCAAVGVSAAQGALAQTDPTLIGAGQRPFVVMVVDSSASMDFSLEGEQRTPCYSNLENPSDTSSLSSVPCDEAALLPGNYPPDSAPAGRNLFQWTPGNTLGDSDNDPFDANQSWGSKDYEDPTVGPEYIGPCMVWKDACSDYARPPWSPEMLDEVGIGGGSGHIPNSDTQYDPRMWERLRIMRGVRAGFTLAYGPDDFISGRPARRLRDDNQPRHVQIKEILTGDMILTPNDDLGGDPRLPLNPQIYGPGCWFVPRMSGVTSSLTQWHACAQVEDTLGSQAVMKSCSSNADCDGPAICRATRFDTKICVREQSVNAFHRFIDREEPRPHIQEVYDRQLQTGIMDNLANTAIFAVAMFDGSQGKIEDESDPLNMNSPVLELNHHDSKQPLINDGVAHDTTAPPEAYNLYNLGVYKIIGPTQLDVPSSQLSSLSAFTQYAVRDAGYLRNYQNENEAKPWRVDPSNPGGTRLEYNFSTGLEKYVQPYQLGQQPLSGATPLAAAMHDIHMYLLHGQYEFNVHGRAESSTTTTYDPESDTFEELNDPDRHFIVDPVQQDPYTQCRPKHVVLMTDGFPEPEKAGSGLSVGTDRLTPEFGYVDADNRYKYKTAEEEIEALVGDSILTMVQGSEEKFKPRVHVVGLNLLDTKTCAMDSDCKSLGVDFSCAKLNGRDVCAIDKNSNDVPDRAEKLGLMAGAGKSCAQWQLVQGEGKKYVPASWGPFGGEQGTCDPATMNCLVRQFPDGGGQSFLTDGPMPMMVNCIAPALILEKNDRFIQEDASSGDRPFRDQLTEALQLVFNQVLGGSGGVASRTRATIINSLDDSSQRGQYRIFSGVDVAGSSVYWKGLLQRQTLLCNAAGGELSGSQPPPLSLSDEIDLQVRPEMTSPSGFEDNRRIFTTFSVLNTDGLSLPPLSGSSDVIFRDHQLMSYVNADADEFQGTRFSGASSQEALVRVPLELPSLLAKLSATVATAETDDFLRAINALDKFRASETVDIVRGRTRAKRDRVLGGILNSNPITIGPPVQDISIGSYSAYREKYGQRASMLYVATLDGLLHAIHTGRGGPEAEFNVLHSDFSDGTDAIVTEGSANLDVTPSAALSQREAWAYSPEMLRNRYDPVRDRQPNLMDGSPTVADVRLCSAETTANQNKQACQAAEGGGVVAPADQWRTVLVQGLGISGAGYFALDVTHTGGAGFTGAAKRPDPIPLWEFDWDWEQRQLMRMKELGLQARYGFASGLQNPSSENDLSDGSQACNDATVSINYSNNGVDELEDLPFLGLSVADAAIGTVALSNIDTSAPARRVQRPVAIFSGGLNGELPGPSGLGAEPNDCQAEERRGRAIYVVDLQTGSLLRRFVDYTDGGGTPLRFQAEVAGSPKLDDSRVGVVSSRAFVGDVAGRLFRIDLSAADPSAWGVELMFDPCGDSDLKSAAAISCDPFTGSQDLVSHPRELGPASFAPAVAFDSSRRLTVVYGLGERADTSTSDQVQAMIAIRERASLSDPHEVAWFTSFEPASSDFKEKLTGPPVVFNFGVYFTTFVEDKRNRCEPGLTRVWGLQLEGDGVAGSKATRGALDFFNEGSSYLSDDVRFSGDPDNELMKWYEPQSPMLMRGVTVAFPPDCSEDITNPIGALFNGAESQMSMPELIATTNTATADLGSAYQANNTASDLSTGNVGSDLKFQVKRLAPPRATLRPLSWAVIGQ